MIQHVIIWHLFELFEIDYLYLIIVWRWLSDTYLKLIILNYLNWLLQLFDTYLMLILIIVIFGLL